MEHEEKEEKIARRSEFLIACLRVIAGLGVVGIALLAPNLFQGLAKLGYHNQARYRTNKVLERLKQNGYVKMDSRGCVEITEKGRRQIDLAGTAKLKLKRVIKWDKKWRIIAFDIPERRKAVRTRFRSIISDFGCAHLQKSVWICPYECEGMIALLKEEFHIRKDVFYITVERFEGDERLVRYFDL